jgi:hypothetical protein
MHHVKSRGLAIAAVVGLSLTGAALANGAPSPEPGRQAAALAPANTVNSVSIINDSIFQADINADVVSFLRTPRRLRCTRALSSTASSRRVNCHPQSGPS